MTSIISWNVNGLRSVIRKGVFSQFIEAESPDILCLQEIKAEKGQVVLDQPEYEEYWNSAEKKGYSGTAIFTKKNFKPIEITRGFPSKIVSKYKLKQDSYGNPDSEGRIITAEFDKFYLVNSYTPNSKPDLSRLKLRHKYWDPAFLEYVTTLNKVKRVIFCGDLNVAHKPIDLARPKENIGKHGFTNEEREGVDKIISSNFIDSFRYKHPSEKEQYTWWSNFNQSRERNVGWRIDYFFVSKELLSGLRNAQILSHIYGSDHCPIRITLK